MLRVERIAEITPCRGCVLESFLSQRPYRGPFNLPAFVEPLGHPVVFSVSSITLLPLSILTGAEVHAHVGMDGVVLQFSVTGFDPDLAAKSAVPSMANWTGWARSAVRFNR